MRCLMLICSASTIGCVSSSSTESRNVEIISLLLGYKLKNQIYFCIIGTSPLRVFLVFYLHHPFCIPHVLVELCHIFHCRTNLPTVCMCLRPWHSSSMTLQSCTHLRTLRYRLPVPIGYYPKWFIAGVCVRWPATSAEARHALPATDEKIQGDRYRYI